MGEVLVAEMLRPHPDIESGLIDDRQRGVRGTHGLIVLLDRVGSRVVRACVANLDRAETLCAWTYSLRSTRSMSQ
jgi:hypothetical protein